MFGLLKNGEAVTLATGAVVESHQVRTAQSTPEYPREPCEYPREPCEYPGVPWSTGAGIESHRVGQTLKR